LCSLHVIFLSNITPRYFTWLTKGIFGLIHCPAYNISAPTSQKILLLMFFTGRCLVTAGSSGSTIPAFNEYAAVFNHEYNALHS
jgi:hypothetical protein